MAQVPCDEDASPSNKRQRTDGAVSPGSSKEREDQIATSTNATASTTRATATTTRATTIINVSVKTLRPLGYADLGAWLKDPNHVYVGRRNFRIPASFDSKWRNSFRIGKKYTREESVRKFTDYLRSSSDLMAALPELRGKVLGCWCAPGEMCHADVLREHVDSSS
eukprot:NODE_4015_length_876_cov_84.255139_g3701_i0.p1 GENE.NODE_4015_length_876_cov_84.255139_g3701_i0~~NODE_4015_length_876_cov_84.255139_g3701_i0.p1  ORF type:complete len:166 (+),score=28.44 NODE_4015_length_876_cov_84.255139_g3701_i0:116-613(+)